MNLSRRELGLLWPAWWGKSSTRTGQAGDPSHPPALPGKVYRPAQIPYEGDSHKKGRRFFYGTDRTGFLLECHETVLGPGVETHTPHRHEHEEILILTEGTLEVVQGGSVETAPAGSVVYLGSNQLHSVRNAGSTPCRYYVIELRGKEA